MVLTSNILEKKWEIFFYREKKTPNEGKRKLKKIITIVDTTIHTTATARGSNCMSRQL